MENGMSCVFGPVPSRRLGRSLGIDLIPFKTCSYDCIYCQLSRTTCKTIERKEWVPLETVLDDLKPQRASRPDWITLSGSGEPTLYARLDELIDGIHAITDVPVAVLTNGSLLWQPDLRKQLLDADLIIPSLDAGDPESFQAINRPAPEISFEIMLKGLMEFRQEFKNRFWLEILLLEGINAAGAPLENLIRCAAQIGPDRIQLNTATRPPAEKYAHPVDPVQLQKIASRFSPPAEEVADYHGIHARRDFAKQKEAVQELLRRRPCTMEDIAEGLGIHRNEAVKYVEELAASEWLTSEKSGSRTFYKINRKNSE
jgi:wyosine [tRNA(Phe)-imidazoG37] synthetase (radical SAM superfamily)